MDYRQRNAYLLAKKKLGLKEKRGAVHNQEIVAFAAEVGHEWVEDDETPWCASFVGAMLQRAGLESTRKLNARSYINWGEPVSLQSAEHGDIVVFWRGDRHGWQGHVGFFDGKRGDDIIVLGGNQNNEVNRSPYPVDRLLSIRRQFGPLQPLTDTLTGESPLVALINRLFSFLSKGGPA